MPYKPTANTMLEQQILFFAFSAEMVPSFSACSSFYREIVLIENLTDSSLVTPAESLGLFSNEHGIRNTIDSTSNAMAN